MWRAKQQTTDEQQDGAPEWMVTFSDCMTLLLTFFVLLLSFSSFDDKGLFRQLKVIFAGAMPSISSAEDNKDAFLSFEQSQHDYDLDQGSEKPTLTKGDQDNLKDDTDPIDFHKQKVFLIPSDDFFLGRGTLISRRGKKVLSTMAAFLKEMPNRLVISENIINSLMDAGDEFGTYDNIGLQRAWAVIEYLTAKQGLDKKRFTISAAGTVKGLNIKQNQTSSEQNAATTKRILEIVLLERSIYN